MATKYKKTAGAHLKKTDKVKAKKTSKDNNGHNGLLAAVLIVIILAAAVLICGFVVGRNGKIHPNISICGVNVGGMTVDEAAKAVEGTEYEPAGHGTVEVIMPAGFDFTVSAADAGISLSGRDAAEAAYAYGHSGAPVRDIIAYVKCLAGKTDEAAVFSEASLNALNDYVGGKLAPLAEMLRDGYYTDVDAGTVRLIKGADAGLNIDEICRMIAEAFNDGEDRIEYDIGISSDPNAPDFDAIRDAVHSECVSAEYDRENDKITEHKVGVDLDVSEALRIWQNADVGELVEIELIITEPEYTTAELEKLIFADVLGTYTTNYSFSDSNRANNVELAADKINGCILMPGEEFSYNDVVQERTVAAGFKPAAAYSGGAVVSEVGGGICQVSSTVYNAALLANLKITARDCHHFPVGYVPAGLDATVSWGGPEFKFVNDRAYPIKIVTSHSSDMKLTVEILGTDVDGSYVEMSYGAYQCYDDTYTDVAVGIAANTYRNVYDRNGNLISQTKEAYSYYYYHDEDIVWPEEDPGEEPIDEPEPIEGEDPQDPQPPAEEDIGGDAGTVTDNP